MRLCTILCVYANALNVKLSNSQLIKLKSGIKNRIEVTLNLSSKLVGNSNDETNFPYKLMLTNAHISKIQKAFTNASTVNINNCLRCRQEDFFILNDITKFHHSE